MGTGVGSGLGCRVVGSSDGGGLGHGEGRGLGHGEGRPEGSKLGHGEGSPEGSKLGWEVVGTIEGSAVGS